MHTIIPLQIINLTMLVVLSRIFLPFSSLDGCVFRKPNYLSRALHLALFRAIAQFPFFVPRSPQG
jgi:hypothetical protein